MAENKKSFILYCDQEGAFEELTDEEAGKLIKHIYRFVNDRNPEPPDRLTKIVFEPIKQQLKRDLKDWENKKVNRSDAGKLGGIKSGEARRKQNEANEANEAMLQNAKQNEANEAVNVNVTDNVNVSVLGKPNGVQPQPIEFDKPLFAHVKQYFQTQNPGGTNYAQNLTDATEFWDHYESNGWMVGNNKMQSWQASVRKWIRNKGQFTNGEVKKAVGEHDWEKALL